MINRVDNFSKISMIPDYEKYDKEHKLLATGENFGNVEGEEEFKGSKGSLYNLTGAVDEIFKDFYLSNTVDLTGFGNIELVVSFENVVETSNATIYLYDEENNMSLPITPPIHKIRDGLQRIRVFLPQQIQGIDYTKIGRIRLWLRSKTGKDVIGKVFRVSAIKTKPIISFNFDDGYQSVYNSCMPILNRYNFRGAAYVITNLINNNETRMTTEQLKHLYSLGWDIGSHSHEHLAHANLTENEIRNDLSKARNLLLNWGFYRSVNTIAMPFGSFEMPKNNITWEFHDYVRGESAEGAGRPSYHTPLPAGNFKEFPYGMYNSVDDDTVEVLKNKIDLAVENGSWFNMNYHNVTNEQVARFEEIVSYVYEKTKNTELQVLVPTEVLLQTPTNNIVNENGNSVQIFKEKQIKVYSVIKK